MSTKSYWQQLERQRISRRRLLAVGGTSAAGLAVVAACSSKTTKGPATGTAVRPSGTPKAGGRYKAATAVVADSTFGLDPHLAIAAGPAYFARMYNVFVNRSAVNSDYYFYDLAADKGLETPNPDGTEFIFTMRPGVKVAPNSLGVPERDIDVQDAIATYDRIKASSLANACQFVCQYFDTYTASTDGKQFTIKIKVPYAWFLFNIGRAIQTIPPRELIANSGVFKNAGVGGGPYKIDQDAFIEGQKVTMEKNTNYYRAGQPYMDGYDIVIIQDRAQLQAQFINQSAYDYGAASDAEVNQLTGQYGVYLGSQDPTYTFIAFTMNVTQAPWTDPKIRKAALHALNRQEYVDRVYQGAAKPNGLVHWPVSGALDQGDLDTYQKYDPAMSKQLIKEATGQDRINVKIFWPQSPIEEHDQHLPIFLKQMDDAGFNVEQDPRDLVGWLNDYRTKNYGASLALNQIYETAEIPLDFFHSKGPAGSNIYATGMQDPDLDNQIDATKRIIDFNARVKAIQDLQKVIYDKGPTFLPIVTPFSRTLYWNFVKNVPEGLGTTGFFLTQNVFLNKA
jgi:peptide/nickel transport system substrate-binding protein